MAASAEAASIEVLLLVDMKGVGCGICYREVIVVVLVIVDVFIREVGNSYVESGRSLLAYSVQIPDKQALTKEEQ